MASTRAPRQGLGVSQHFTAMSCGCVVLGYAILLLDVGGAGPLTLVPVGLLAAHVVLSLTLWRRGSFDHRTARRYWLDAVVLSAPLAASAVAWLALERDEVSPFLAFRADVLWWMPCALLMGAILVTASPTNVRALLSGDLAFLAGDLPSYKAAARTLMVAVSTPSEEMMFRVLPAALGQPWLTMVAGGTAFVANHHIGQGVPVGTRWRLAGYEAVAAITLGALVVVSGSAWPSLAAHVIANIPIVALDWQRTRSFASDDTL